MLSVIVSLSVTEHAVKLETRRSGHLNFMILSHITKVPLFTANNGTNHETIQGWYHMMKITF